jgi:hypothetical protein
MRNREQIPTKLQRYCLYPKGLYMKPKTRAVLCVAPFASLTFASLACVPADFEFNRDCRQWLNKRGYSVDYILLKTGKRQPGMATKWRSNVAAKEVQFGDVVTSRLRERPAASRASYVEEVRRNADGSPSDVRVSEWNMGRYTDKRCFVTDKFGILTEKWIPVDALVVVWRPSLPL